MTKKGGVVGSGIGGLASAIHLAARGYKVNVFEKPHKGEEWNFDNAITADMEREVILEYITNKINIYK